MSITNASTDWFYEWGEVDADEIARATQAAFNYTRSMLLRDQPPEPQEVPAGTPEVSAETQTAMRDAHDWIIHLNAPGGTQVSGGLTRDTFPALLRETRRQEQTQQARRNYNTDIGQVIRDNNAIPRNEAVLIGNGNWGTHTTSSSSSFGSGTTLTMASDGEYYYYDAATQTLKLGGGKLKKKEEPRQLLIDFNPRDD